MVVGVQDSAEVAQVVDASTIKRRESEEVEEYSDKWDQFDVNKWRAAMFMTRGYFKQLYEDTPEFVRQVIVEYRRKNRNGKIRVIEVGSGTGEFIFSLAEDADYTIGVEFNKKFVDFCNERMEADHAEKNMKFVLGDAQELVKVLSETGTAPSKNELVIVACVNNTLGIMPDDVRHKVYLQIKETLKLFPENSVFVAGFWDGDHFGNSVQHFYGDNPVLCGDLTDAKIDWDNHVMTTTSGYTTRWTSPDQAYDTITSYGFKCVRSEARSRGVLVEARLPTKEEVEGQMARELTTDSERVSQDYYDSDDAFKFYTNVWGGDNIHIGCYDECAVLGVEDKVEQVRLASVRILELLTSKVDIQSHFRVMDCGSALGGASRYMAKTFGCHVLGVDLSKKECQMNVQKTIRAGLSHLVDVKCCSFTDTGEEAGSYDLVISEDSYLHAGQFRADCITEAARLLRPGGFLVFTDPMQADEPDREALAPIYKRIHLEDMGSVKFYKACAEKNGLDFVEFDQMTEHLVNHYSTVQQILREKEEHLINNVGISPEYVANMDKGLSYWVEGGKASLLNYGILVFQKPPQSIDDLAQAAAQAAQAAQECALMAQNLARESASSASSRSSE